MNSKWYTHVKSSVAGRRFIFVGTSFSNALAISHLGGELAGIINAVPENIPRSIYKNSGSILNLHGEKGDIFDFMLEDFASMIAKNKIAVRQFLKNVDPEETAIVVSQLPVPAEIFEGREILAQDFELTKRIETKLPDRRLLPVSLLQVPFVATKPRRLVGMWEELSAEEQAAGIVVQKTGLNSGGTGTFLCRNRSEVLRCADQLAADGDVRVMGLINGQLCNVMGLVLDGREVVKMPVSVQLTSMDAAGRPIYGGNRFEAAFLESERDLIGQEVKSVGLFLYDQGFRGPFGVDFIRTLEGQRFYIDLNPRRNGVLDNILFAAGEDLSRALFALCLVHGKLTKSEIDELETTLQHLVDDAPHSKFFLTGSPQHSTTISQVPPTGVWMENEFAFEYVGKTGTPGTCIASDNQFYLRTAAVSGTKVRPGEQYLLGEVFCGPKLAERLTQKWGVKVHKVLMDGLTSKLIKA